MKKREKLFKLLDELKDEIESFKVVFKDDTVLYKAKYKEPITSHWEQVALSTDHTEEFNDIWYSRSDMKLGVPASYDSNANPLYKKENEK